MRVHWPRFRDRAADEHPSRGPRTKVRRGVRPFGGDDLAIGKGVIGLAAAFRREVIAEGVETHDHGTLLLKLGCAMAQGYAIARPMPAHALPAWVQGWQAHPVWVGNAAEKCE